MDNSLQRELGLGLGLLNFFFAVGHNLTQEDLFLDTQKLTAQIKVALKYL